MGFPVPLPFLPTLDNFDRAPPRGTRLGPRGGAIKLRQEPLWKGRVRCTFVHHQDTIQQAFEGSLGRRTFRYYAPVGIQASGVLAVSLRP